MLETIIFLGIPDDIDPCYSFLKLFFNFCTQISFYLLDWEGLANKNTGVTNLKFDDPHTPSLTLTDSEARFPDWPGPGGILLSSWHY
jgi:hypothetical protein